MMSDHICILLLDAALYMPNVGMSIAVVYLGRAIQMLLSAALRARCSLVCSSDEPCLVAINNSCTAACISQACESWLINWTLVIGHNVYLQGWF